MDISLVAGVSDPYLSGLTFGIVYILIEAARTFLPFMSLSFTPDFIQNRFVAKVDGRISLRLILFVIPLLRFFFSKEFREYRSMRVNE